VAQKRDKLKKRKKEYLYFADKETSIYPILGSFVRAIGKGWKLGAVSSGEDYETFQKLNKILKNAKQFNVHNFDDYNLKNIVKDDFKLVLINSFSHLYQVKQIRDSVLGKAHSMVSGYDTIFPLDYDLISRFETEIVNDSGITTFTGNGKGKSTSAYGIAIEDIVSGGRVAIVQWFKEIKSAKMTWRINEHYFPDKLIDPNIVTFYPTGLGFFGSPDLDRVEGEQAYQLHKDKAYRGVELASKLVDSGKYSSIVLDEFIDTIPEVSKNIENPLLDLDTVIDFLKYCRNTNTKIIVTGRRVINELKPVIGTSYTINEKRHPYSAKGTKAISGLDL